jgi:hypothetical protein
MGKIDPAVIRELEAYEARRMAEAIATGQRAVAEDIVCGGPAQLLRYAELLRRAGWYEWLLLQTLVEIRGNHHDTPLTTLHALVDLADRAKMRSAWPPPGDGPYVLYRGVFGRTPRERRVRGLHWTPNLELAQRFATTITMADRYDPAVYTITAPPEWVVAYVDHKIIETGPHEALAEEDFIVRVPRHIRPQRVGDLETDRALDLGRAFADPVHQPQRDPLLDVLPPDVPPDYDPAVARASLRRP